MNQLATVCAVTCSFLAVPYIVAPARYSWRASSLIRARAFFVAIFRFSIFAVFLVIMCLLGYVDIISNANDT